MCITGGSNFGNSRKPRKPKNIKKVKIKKPTLSKETLKNGDPDFKDERTKPAKELTIFEKILKFFR